MGKRFVELVTNSNSGDGSGGIPDYTPIDIGSGNQVVTTAGTSIQLASSLSIGEVIITANFDNTGTICTGDSNVIADESTRRGIPMQPNDTIIIPIDNLNKIWLDSTISNDGVTYLWVK